MDEYTVGQKLTSPRGGVPVTVVQADHITTIATSSGSFPRGFGCTHEHPNAAYYEYLAGPSRGSHGWFDANFDCGLVFQVG